MSEEWRAKGVWGLGPGKWEITEEKPQLVVSDGGSTSYYKLPDHATELRHLISHKGMSKSRGDIFKACYRLGEKEGADMLYDINKIIFFAQDLKEMYERGEHV
jgi:hypothetical protein